METKAIRYKREGDYLIPDIELKKQKPIGHYGRMRKAYLEAYQPAMFVELLLSERLFDHCAKIEQEVENRLELLIPKLAERDGVDEKLKAAVGATESV